MNTIGEFIIHTDGGARGNPGPAAFAFIIRRPDGETIEEKGFLGKTTNNIAEYTALVRALERARELGGRRLLIHSDSELMVKQMKGEYKVKNEGLLPLFQQARQLVREFDQVTLRHVPRAQNKDADQLCNEAMDNPGTYAVSQLPPKPRIEKPFLPEKETNPEVSPPQPKIDFQNHVQKVGLAYLRSCADAWARGNPLDPDPADVWEQICAIINSRGGG